jgi:CDP-glucose 4,6-dehydratase
MFQSAFSNKRVWLSGHTGFKGSWLAHWLTRLGADVKGYALPPNEYQPLFDWLDLHNRVKSEFNDIRDEGAVRSSIQAFQPDFVFHLAAQPLVRLSYRSPKETIETNSTGTINVLESLRNVEHKTVAIFVTTDKCYRNVEWLYSYREHEPLGGNDPYSASKAMAELAIHSYRHSFFATAPQILIASARAGNVIGGGDFAPERIVPDLVRSQRQDQPLAMRNPNATRPWQHVLEPLSGYLTLAAQLSSSTSNNSAGLLTDAFNFGPDLNANQTVASLVAEFQKTWPGRSIAASEPNAPHEAKLLNLAIDKAYHLLSWKPVWDFEEAVSRTALWYRKQVEGVPPLELVTDDLEQYLHLAQRKNLAWTH